MSDPFAAFGLPPTASLPAVRRRYRELAKRYHPDAGTEPCGQRMAEVNRAYAE